MTPATLTLAPGETQDLHRHADRNGAADDVWNYGIADLERRHARGQEPGTARTGKSIVAPALVTGDTVSATRLVTIQTGFGGRMGANRGGLKNVTLGPSTSLQPNSGLSATAVRTACLAGGSANVAAYPVTVPAGTIVARFALRDADVGQAGDDFDLSLIGPANTTIASSGNDGSNEAVEVVSPAPGNYRVCVYAYASGNSSATMTHRLSSWVVTNTDNPGNLRVMLPGVVYPGGQATVAFSWSGLIPGGRYVGGVEFLDASAVVQATTEIRVDPIGLPPVGAPGR